MSHSVIIPYRYPDPIEYREVVGFPSYRVGNDGSVWTRRPLPRSNDRSWTEWRLMKPHRQKRGRAMVGLYDDDGVRFQKYVHAMVLEAFVGPRPPECEGCHAPDNNPDNNALCNLRWDTPANNQADRVAAGTSNRGERCGTSIHTEADILEIRRLAKSGMTQKEIGKKFGIHQAAVSVIVRRINWKHLLEEDSNAEAIRDN